MKKDPSNQTPIDSEHIDGIDLLGVIAWIATIGITYSAIAYFINVFISSWSAKGTLTNILFHLISFVFSLPLTILSIYLINQAVQKINHKLRGDAPDFNEDILDD